MGRCRDRVADRAETFEERQGFEPSVTKYVAEFV
jgi:hypothetical protein